jgi:hypothetical protein
VNAAPVIIIMGLERTGANWLGWLLRHNVPGATIISRQRGVYRHGQPPGSREATIAGLAEPLRGMVAAAYDRGEIRWLFTTKHPASWLLSWRRHFTGTPNEWPTGQIVAHWNEWTTAQLAFCDGDPARRQMVRYESLLNDGELAAIARWAGLRVLEPTVRASRRIGPEGEPDGPDFEADYYRDERWWGGITAADLAALHAGIAPEVLTRLDYRLEAGGSGQQSAISPQPVETAPSLPVGSVARATEAGYGLDCPSGGAPGRPGIDAAANRAEWTDLRTAAALADEATRAQALLLAERSCFGWTTTADFFGLYELARKTRGHVLELGTYRGKSTLALAKGMPTTRRASAITPSPCGPGWPLAWPGGSCRCGERCWRPGHRPGRSAWRSSTTAMPRKSCGRT